MTNQCWITVFGIQKPNGQDPVVLQLQHHHQWRVTNACDDDDDYEDWGGQRLCLILLFPLRMIYDTSASWNWTERMGLLDTIENQTRETCTSWSCRRQEIDNTRCCCHCCDETMEGWYEGDICSRTARPKGAQTIAALKSIILPVVCMVWWRR